MNETSWLWKANASTSTAADSTVSFSASSVTLPILASQEEEDPGYVSDPPPNKEEAYISLTPVHLVPYAGEAIRASCLTKEEIATYLKRADARWARVEGWGACRAC
ncbi:hypothetical protein FIBSPDRAFT_958603 [Athelia psychrophila]|uniref:Uncharacterized protein n=1 Tax=Athelia psychrophila TaxID=1759441 RepID=A0A166EHH3_9AGAM|nr:hypothetical protein FIBSPDRAFT_958603 [Fibularhizoctonia sp. CBS 109695]